MSNQIETVQMQDGVVKFDYSTGVMTAKWNNGYSETWSPHYGIKAATNGFYRFIEQEERITE